MPDIIGSIEKEIHRLNTNVDELKKTQPKNIIEIAIKMMIVDSLERIRDDCLELGK